MSVAPPVSTSPNHAPFVHLWEVSKRYEGGTAPVAALVSVSLDVQRGERVALLGKSGSGKSTLLNLLGGLDRPSTGVLEVDGQDLARLSSNGLARYRLRTVGMIFQAYNLVAGRTALQNVVLPLAFAGRPPRERYALGRQALEQVGLGQRLRHRPNELSGGEQQRVAIARALINNPPLLLADEPTGNLDSDNAREVMDLLSARVRDQGATLLLVTHDEELARRYTDRVVWIKDGHLLS